MLMKRSLSRGRRDCSFRTPEQQTTGSRSGVSDIVPNKPSVTHTVLELDHFRDLFSLTAVLRGLSNGGVGLEPELSVFLDESQNCDFNERIGRGLVCTNLVNQLQVPLGPGSWRLYMSRL